MALNVKLDVEDATAAITRFIRDHVEDSGAQGVVLGLSSGLDSAVAATLAVRAIGSGRVHPVFMPSSATPAADREQARAIAEGLGLTLDERGVDAIIETIASAVGEHDRDTLANAAARARMTILFGLARKNRLMVLGTSNKSELLIGYFTKFGDGASDLLPLGDLYKTQVRLLGAHLGLGDAVLKKPPSAGLWEGQTDEGELGLTYDVLDRVLLGFELGLRPDEITARAETDAAIVQRIARMLRGSEHKRNTPRVCKIGIRTIGRDWRRAVTEGGPPEA